MARTKRNTRIAQTAMEPQMINLVHEAQQKLNQLERQREMLELRLRTGEELITMARSRGEQVSRWEAHWISLLNEYEQISVQIEMLLDDGKLSATNVTHRSAA